MCPRQNLEGGPKSFLTPGTNRCLRYATDCGEAAVQVDGELMRGDGWISPLFTFFKSTLLGHHFKFGTKLHDH